MEDLLHRLTPLLLPAGYIYHFRPQGSESIRQNSVNLVTCLSPAPCGLARVPERTKIVIVTNPGRANISRSSGEVGKVLP
jgi:hypothetical protein